MKRQYLTALIIFVLVFALMPIVQAQSAKETLNQYISDLQNNPNDTALREKIIKHVQGMKSSPAIPEEANRHFVMAGTFQKKAKDIKEYELAISEYKEALLVAPWWPEAYNNMGLLLEQAGRYDEAISTLRLYITTNPPDARAAQNKIYQIEAAKKMAETERIAAEVKKSKEVDLRGTWCQEPAKTCWCYKFAVNGKEVIITQSCPALGEDEELVGWATLNERTFEGKMNTSPDKLGGTACAGSLRGIISEDSKNIKISFPSCHGGTYGYNLIRK